MKPKNNKQFKAARNSLNEILKTLGPYIPKKPKIKESQEPIWESMGTDTFPVPQHRSRKEI